MTSNPIVCIFSRNLVNVSGQDGLLYASENAHGCGLPVCYCIIGKNFIIINVREIMIDCFKKIGFADMKANAEKMINTETRK
ncbi:MAG: hypothetical protein WDO19_25935 [Bacteroidota bacterium]